MMELNAQVMRFLVVGGIAAGVDFLGYNGFLHYLGRGRRVLASALSVTFAMTTSFLLNRGWAFAELNGDSWPVVEFVGVTLISAYGIQSGVIYGLSRARGARAPEDGKRPGESESMRWDWRMWLKSDFVERNLIKAAALGTALVWNFSWYRWYVFA